MGKDSKPVFPKLKNLVGPDKETIELYEEMGIDLEEELKADAEAEAKGS